MLLRYGTKCRPFAPQARAGTAGRYRRTWPGNLRFASANLESANGKGGAGTASAGLFIAIEGPDPQAAWPL